LYCCAGGGLMIHLGFQLIDGVLLGLHAYLECCDLVALRLDEGGQAAGMGVAGIV